MPTHIAPTTSLGPAPMDVDATKRQFTQPLSCWCCGNVHFMTAEEQEKLLKHWMVAAADVQDVADEEEVEKDDLEDFVLHRE